jgi:hypothetical protein
VNILDKYCSAYYGKMAGLIFFESAVEMGEIRDGLDAKNVDYFIIVPISRYCGRLPSKYWRFLEDNANKKEIEKPDTINYDDYCS